MFGILKKIFFDPNQETIEIFERATKIEYDSKLFLSLHVLSLTHTQLKNLVPLSVFTNIEILNLAHNEISDITPLKALKALKIVDLRFNKIREIPSWLYELDKPLYWSRDDEEREGIYLEGNPLNESTILKIKNREVSSSVESSIIPIAPPVPIENNKKKLDRGERLEPLNTQHLAIFIPHKKYSQFLDEVVMNNLLVDTFDMKLHINVSLLEYDENNTLLEPPLECSPIFPYIMVILKESECYLKPHLWESLIKQYPSSKIFLMMEGSMGNIDERKKFFSLSRQSHKIVEFFHAFDTESNLDISKKIFTHFQSSQEVNSLWKLNWIALKEEIEKKGLFEMTFLEYEKLAEQFLVSQEMRDYLFEYLKRVGTIRTF